MKHLAEITSWYLVDYIQISGGDYETPGESLGRSFSSAV